MWAPPIDEHVGAGVVRAVGVQAECGGMRGDAGLVGADPLAAEVDGRES